MRLSDWTFQKLFERAFVYNILFEDTEVDERFLHIDDKSAILAISGAGCGVANHLSRQPRRLDAVDINRHHLALSALKIAAARRLESHEEVYSLFGRGWHPSPEQVVPRLASELPEWMQCYWNRHYGRFTRSLIQEGLTAKMLRVFRELSGLDADWLRRRIGETVEDRQRAVETALGPLLRHPVISRVMESPLQLVALGVNFSQRDRIVETEGIDIVDFLVMHLKRVAATDLERNWFAWYAVAGHYNHATEDAVPPYLRSDRHEAAREAQTNVRFHNQNIFKVLSLAGRRSWSHYTLCDAVDWMSEPSQRRLFDEILRTSTDGARVLYRSVEEVSLVERLGLERHFRLDREASDEATELDRTRQYRRVNFYTVCH